MKLRITALMLAIIMLLTLLSGCGAAEAETEATTAAAEEAPTTEPITEPTTEPTEPPTALEQLNYVLWDEATTVAEYGLVHDGVQPMNCKYVEGSYENFKIPYRVYEQPHGGLVERPLTTPVKVELYQVVLSSLESDTDWGFLNNQLIPFYEYAKKMDADLTYEEWFSMNRDKKVISVDLEQIIDGEPVFNEAIENGLEELGYDMIVQMLEIVEMQSGDYFYPTELSDPIVPEMGIWHLEKNGEAEEILSFYTYRMTSRDQYGFKYDFTQEMNILVPESLDTICFRLGEASDFNNDDSVPENVWETGNILDDQDDGYKYYFFGADLK